MKLVFKYLKIHNFLSFEDAEVQLNGNNFTLIKGINENPDDAALSNGSGKSSLFDAISWGLTGETIRGTKEVTRIGSEGRCSVSVEFDVDGVPYVVTRTKDPSNLFITIDGVDKSGKGIRDTSKLLSEYLPDLNSSLIGSVIIMGQGLPQRFSNNTPSGRKEVLEKLSKSDFMIEDIKKRVAERKLKIATDIRESEDLGISLSSTIKMLDFELEENKKLLESMNNDVLEKELSKIKNTLDETIINLKTLQDKRAILQDSFNHINTEIDDETHKFTDDRSVLDFSYNEDRIEGTSKISELRSHIDALFSEITRLESITDVCPTCKQKIIGVHKPDTSKQRKELSALKDQLEDANNALKEINNKHNEDIKELSLNYLNKVDPLKKELEDISNQLSETDEDIEELKKKCSEFEASKIKTETEISNFNTICSSITEKIDSDTNKRFDISEKMLYNNSRLKDLNDHLDVINKMSVLITRDFRGYLLTNVIDFINRKAKEYSQDIFGTAKIDFSLDGNNINISYDSKEYETLSGGEKQKVDIIVQLSIRDMLCTYLQFSSNILVLDEISDNIDSAGSERLFNLISTKLSDVDSIFIISHHNDFEIPTDNEITICKGKDKISRII